jgi:hypothetical protein
MSLSLACDVPASHLEPLATDPADYRWEPALLGTWLPESSSVDTVRISRSGYARYTIEGTLGHTAQHLTGRVVEVAGSSFLDLTNALVEADGHEALIVPVHLIVRFRVRDDTLWTGWLSDTVWEAVSRRLGSPTLQVRGMGLLLAMPSDTIQMVLAKLIQDSTLDWHIDPLVRPTPDSAPLPKR